MADIIRSLTEMASSIGVGIMVVIFVMAAAGFVGYWNNKLVNKITDLQCAMIDRQNTVITENTNSADRNTKALGSLGVIVADMVKMQKVYTDKEASHAEDKATAISKAFADGVAVGVERSKIRSHPEDRTITQ